MNETQEARRKAEADSARWRAEAEQLRREMDGFRSRPPAQPPPAQPAGTATLTDEERKNAAIREGLIKLFPELAKLPDLAARLANAGRWDEAAEATGSWRKAEMTFYDNHTETQLSKLYDLAAGAVIGAGKSGKDLPDMMRGALDNSFGRWVFADPVRRQRYDALDGRLVEEFWPLFKASNIDPLRRSDSAAVMASVAGRPKLPVGGSVTGAPPPAATRQPSAASEDDDAIFDRSWEIAKAELAKG